MAVVVVSVDNVRIAQAEATPDTGTWGNDGGGGGVADEPDLFYQGVASQSRKVSTARIGRNYTHGSGTDMTATDRQHFIAKIAATNFGALLARTTPAMGIKMGSGSAAYYEYYVFGNDNYPPKGGFQILAISPNVSGYRDATSGSPTLTSVLYWSLIADYSATSKSENTIIDAIDVGAGLGLVGGDGGSTDGVFQDFVDFDEGTVGNRYGYVFTEGGVLFPTGRLAVGQTATGTSTVTEFIDSGITLVWTNGLVETGFHRFLLDLATAGTDIQLTNCSLGSQGQVDNDGDRGYTTTEDSRPAFEVTGSNASADAILTSCVIDNFAEFTLNNRVQMLTCVITDSGQIDAGNGADLRNTSISGYTGAADTSALLWDTTTPTTDLLDGMTFTAHPSTLSHAIEFSTTSATTINLTDITFSGYSASNNVNDSAIHIRRTSGTVTVNLSNVTGTVSYRTDGAIVEIVEAVSVAVTAVDANTGLGVENARVSLEAATGGDLAGSASTTITTSGTTATATCTAHGMATGDTAIIRGANELDLNGIFTITVTGVNTFTYTIVSIAGAPGTGTITTTAQILEGLTGPTGEVSVFPSFNYTSDQPVTGRIRKGTTSPLYKTAGIVGTITSAGFGPTIAMIPDE